MTRRLNLIIKLFGTSDDLHQVLYCLLMHWLMPSHLITSEGEILWSTSATRL